MPPGGKVAVVTGAASGIGRATAQLFAANRANVLAVDHGHARWRRGDSTVLGRSGRRGNGGREAVSRFGDLDILINNAGVGHNALAEMLPLAAWDGIFSVNLRGIDRLDKPEAVEFSRSLAHRGASGYRINPGW